tara:strand:+ start:214 stop:465 length:252 start_codon:yes stop_codon:yes gene_type:complete
MAITKTTEIGKIEIVSEYKHVQVRTDTVIKEDGVELSRKYHRHVLTPDADITNEHADVKAICNTVWTDDVKAAWKTFQDNEKL